MLESEPRAGSPGAAVCSGETARDARTPCGLVPAIPGIFLCNRTKPEQTLCTTAQVDYQPPEEIPTALTNLERLAADVVKLETENGMLRAALAEARATIAQLRPEPVRDDASVSTDAATMSTDVLEPVRKRGRPRKTEVRARVIDTTAASALGPVVCTEPLAEVGWQVARRAEKLRKCHEFDSREGMTEFTHDSLPSLMHVISIQPGSVIMWVGCGCLVEVASLECALSPP